MVIYPTGKKAKGTERQHVYNSPSNLLLWASEGCPDHPNGEGKHTGNHTNPLLFFAGVIIVFLATSRIVTTLAERMEKNPNEVRKHDPHETRSRPAGVTVGRDDDDTYCERSKCFGTF